MKILFGHWGVKKDWNLAMLPPPSIYGSNRNIGTIATGKRDAVTGATNAELEVGTTDWND
jgi:hypothetical protein